MMMIQPKFVLQFMNMNLLMAQVKEFIRRAKAWRNRVWSKGAGGTGRPKSYLISLLVLRAYEKASEKVSKDRTQAIAKQ